MFFNALMQAKIIAKKIAAYCTKKVTTTYLVKEKTLNVRKLD